ncbi:polysaccharide deacetylase family protein, partial [Methanomethylovorans sp. PtaU1.Bin093]|uniref:polysaccharide deacetylase family protein n=1 Tax=Methanomethylovorans sp. PtaU1.Bin093 TaxID=1811679 RepID=UPI0025E835C1
SDTDGTIVAYLWTSDGKEISTEASFSTSLLAVGTHTVKFSVKDDDGAWSAETTSTLKIEPSAEVPSRATVILTFDDGFKSDYDTVYPLLKERNISSTHYIIASMVGEDSTRMTWDHIKAMYDDGFDMECHSDTHPDLTTMSSDEIIQEMLNVNTAFVTHGMPAPKHIAYPYGECNDNVISVISSYRDTGRVVTWKNNGYYPTELLEKPYGLPCYPTEYHGTIAEIDKAVAGNYTLILGFHQVTENPGEYDISTSEFISILDYIESNNIRTQTISEYYKENFE